MTPRVSVLMPIYNGERWLSRAIESVLAQTFTDFELVAVDDGSTDGSAAVIESFAARDPRVRLVRAEHAGMPITRSISVAEARAPLAAFLDQDDEWLPHRLERQLPYVNERTVVFSDTYLAEGDKRTGRRWSDWDLVPRLRYPATDLFPHFVARGCFVPMLTVLAPRQLLLDAGAFRYAELHGHPSTEGTCDFEMWLLLALRGVRFHYVDQPLAVNRHHADSISADQVRMWESHLVIQEALMPAVQESDRRLLRRWRTQTRRVLEIEHRKRGWQQIVAGDSGAARRDLARSLRVRPYSPRAWIALSLSLYPPLARRVARGRT